MTSFINRLKENKMDLASLRKMRSTDFASITKAIETIANPQAQKDDRDDDRFWKLNKDKAGNGSAVIRFLPASEGDELPWVKMIDHGFKGPTGRWYIEKSLATIGQTDIVSEKNSELWNSGLDSDKEIARAQKRRTSFIANILVVSDPSNPANNGTIRLFKFGKKIMDKIKDKANPTFEDEKPVNVFDYWEGANFKLRMKQVEGYPNYDASVFESSTPVAEEDEDILAIAKKQYLLKEFHDPKNFKTAEELKKKYNWVMNTEGASSKAEDVVMESRAAPEPKAKAEPEVKAARKVSFDEEEDDDFSIEKFKALAND